jgi:hypothetical protein
VDGAAPARLAQDLADEASYDQRAMVVAHSMRNRFPGLVTRVVRDTVTAARSSSPSPAGMGATRRYPVIGLARTAIR